MKRSCAAMMLLALVGCENQLDVEVSTAVGSRSHRDDPQAVVKDLRAVAEALLVRTDPKLAPTDVIAQPVHPPSEGSELDELMTAIRKGPLDEIGGPARRIAAAPRALWPELRKAILAPRKAPKGDYRSMLRAIGGDVPNRYGYFELAWKKAHGHNIKVSTDWFEDLLAIPRSKLSPMLTQVYRDCVIETAMLRAASAIGRDPQLADDVVAALLDAAYVHEGTFRDEVGRAIQAVGDDAVAPLVLAAIRPADDRDDAAMKRAEYAAHQLDRMDRWVPERAEAALRSDPRRLAALLRAWGVAHTGEAAQMMLLHVDARIPAVRDAARTAFLALVDGEPAKVISRSVRLLGGGTGRAQAFLNFRQHAGIAVRDTLARENPELLEAWCGPPEPGQPIDPRCEDQPSRHAHAYFDWLDQRRAAEEAATIDAALAERDPEQAIEKLDRLLAEQPELAAPQRLADVYRQGATAALANSDAARAAALSRKAAVLVEREQPTLAETLRVQALLAEAATEGLPTWGRSMLLRSAEELRPGDPHIAQARRTLVDADAPDAIPPRRIALGAGVVLFAFAGLGGIGAGVARKRAR